MANLISDRVAYFLKEYPPFSFLNEKELEDISVNITIQYVEEADVIFQESEPNTGFVYVLRKGSVELYKTTDAINVLIDKCEPGDVFGVRSVLTAQLYKMTAKASEESLIYSIRTEQFKKILEENHQFALFFAAGYASGQIIAGKNRVESKFNLPEKESEPVLIYPETVLTCTVENSVYEAAELMSSRKVGSIIIVDSDFLPLGIITDTDLRNKVLAKRLPDSTSVTAIMTSPVQTIGPNPTIVEVQITFMKSQIHHLVVTEDGTNKSRLKGIISDHDIIMSGNNHPAAFLKEIRNSNDPLKWKETRNKLDVLTNHFLGNEASIPLISTLITSINDAIIQKAIEYAIIQVPEAGSIPFSWLCLGSEGREEQLLRTDLDNAIVFRSNGNIENEQNILLKVAEIVIGVLIDCGFEKCPANIMATNPEYCQPVDKWKEYYSDWIRQPDEKALMNATIFFDFRAVIGNEDIEEELQGFLLNEIKSFPIFINFLAKNALQNPPPLSFFNKFLVEKSGEHKDEFDIKKRAMMPLSDIARLLLLSSGKIGIQNTIERLKFISSTEDKNSSLFNDAVQAFEVFLKIRAKNGLQNNDSGRFIDISALSKLEKQSLKNAFQVISEIQEIVKIRFQLSYFN